MINATDSDNPVPTTADVAPSISRMPGPPRGPSLRTTMADPGAISPPRIAAIASSSISNTRAGPLNFQRRALELSAALTLAQAPDPDVLSALGDAHGAMLRAVADDDASALVDADIRFHDLLIASLGNRRLLRVSETYAVELRLCITRLGEQYSLPAEAVAEHLAIIDAVASRRPAAVIRAIDTHMSNAVALLVRDAGSTNETTARVGGRGTAS